MSAATQRPQRPQGVSHRHRRIHADGSVTVTKVVTDAYGVTRRSQVTVVPCDAHKA